MANKGATPKKDEGTSVGATATVSTPKEVHDTEFYSVMEHVDLGDEDDEGESFKNFMEEVTVIEPITMEKLQTRFQY